MSNAAQPTSTRDDASPIGTELVLMPLEGQRTSRTSDPSGIRLRPVSSLPPPPETPLARPQLALRVALGVGLVIAVGAFSWSLLVALYGADLALAPAVLSGLGLTMLLYFAASVLQALRYQPTALVARSRLPAITVIVPTHEEGACARRAVESAIESGYPLDRLEVIAIDDHSRDGTWDHLCELAEAHPDVVKLIRQPRPRGTREALRSGILRASGEFVVTLEATAEVTSGALEALVAPMVRDEKVAAVAGRTLFADHRRALTRLLAARLALSFDLTRAAQSGSGAVLSTPLTLSAYRTEAALDVLGRWSSQTFLGKACTAADDRALTSELLRAGHRSTYQRTAVVKTAAPTTWAGAAQRFVRTERSNLREDLLILPMLFGPWQGDRTRPAIEVLFELAQAPLSWLAMTLIVLEAGAHPLVLASAACVLVGFAIAQNLYVLRAGALREFAWGVGSTVVASLSLLWALPYSLATVGASGQPAR